MKNIWTENPWVFDEIVLVKDKIKSNNDASIKEIKNIISDITDSNGKMIRPGLVIIGSNFGDYDRKKIIPLAGSIEMLHMATLVHDDIIDNSDSRRGKESTRKKYGNHIAVYAGDYLLSKSISILTGGSYDEKSVTEIPKAVEKICASEMLQYKMKGSRISFKQYLRIISGKTAALFAVSLYAGAKESGCDEKLAFQLGKIGYELGVAFQIIDDILDFTSTEEELGKPCLNDVEQGYYTLPLLLAIDENPSISDLLRKDKKVNTMELKKILDETLYLKKSRKIAQRYTNRAFDRLDKLPNCHAKSALNEIINKMIVREY